MLKEGFSIIGEYDDPPHESFPSHDHPGDQLLVVLKGSVEVIINGKISILKPGGEIYTSAKTIHDLKIGPDGCSYIEGERSTSR